jgi:hypothetical protein
VTHTFIEDPKQQTPGVSEFGVFTIVEKIDVTFVFQPLLRDVSMTPP